MTQLLIGLAGRAGSGKTTIADHWKRSQGFVEYAFANPLKKMLADLLMVDLEQLDSMKRHGSPVLPVPAGFADHRMATVREALQTLGTEWGRQCVHPDIWLIVAGMRLDWLAGDHSFRGVVVSDIRFDNEADFIRRRGGVVIHLSRAHMDAATPAHSSELPVARRAGDFHIVNDQGIDVLLAQADAVLRAIHQQRAAA